ncbi:hypothetical protein [Roseateles sp.]|uniref:hypothetical protein n=1 Tax=Roseateles sp. TaxID=1971397 RepID=UPI00392B1DFA
MVSALHYFARLPVRKQVLWCYLIWYLVTVATLFDPSPLLWLNSVGISAVIGFALQLSVAKGAQTDRWQTFRLFMMPFGVSSFASLIKDKGYVLVFPSDMQLLLISVAACGAFLTGCALLRRIMP